MRQAGRSRTANLSISGLTFCGLIAASLAAQPQPSSDQSLSAPLRTFTIRVPRDYGKRDGQSVPLRVGVARAIDPNARADPIFVIEGLGESGVDAAGQGLIASLEELRHTHDLIFIDQRGTSIAPLLCPPIAVRTSVVDDAAPIFDPRRLAKCRRSFQGRIGLDNLNSLTFAEDVEAVRRRLGYKRIELIGYFYGTRIVQQYLRLWPRRSSAAVLADISPMNYPAASAEAGALSGSIASTLRACQSDKSCESRYPDLAAEWMRASKRLSGKKIEVDGDEAKTPAEINGTGILDWMKFRTLRWVTAVTWPRDVDAIAKGDLAPLVRQYLAYRHALLTSYPLALRVSVDCAESFPLEAPLPLGGRSELLRERKGCATWPAHRLSPKLLRTLHTKTPILVVTAEFDAEAPASFVRGSVVGLSNAQLVVFPDRARATDYDWDECLGPLAAAFLQTEGRDQLDTRCVNNLKRPPFVTIGRP